MDDDALDARIDEIAWKLYPEIQRRENAEYDGIMGKLDNWIPENFHNEFSAIRNKLLATYPHRDLLAYIAEMRREYGGQGHRDAGELAELIELHGALQERELGLTPGGMFSGAFRPRTPAPIWRDVYRLAIFQEAVELGQEKGLPLLLGDELAKTATIGTNTRREQSKKAQLPRGKLGDDGEPNSQIIGRLALAAEYKELSAKELFTHYLSELDRLNLDPDEKANGDDWREITITYDFKDRRKSITGGQFAKVVSDYRTGKKLL